MKKTTTTMILLALLTIMVIVTACNSPNTQTTANSATPQQQTTEGANNGSASNAQTGTDVIVDNSTGPNDVSSDMATVNTPDNVGSTDDLNVSTDIPQ